MRVKSKNSPERLLLEIMKLEPIEFLGICKILGVKVYDEEAVESAKPRDFYDLWEDVCDVVSEMNRTRRRNLSRLVRAANKKEK